MLRRELAGITTDYVASFDMDDLDTVSQLKLDATNFVSTLDHNLTWEAIFSGRFYPAEYDTNTPDRIEDMTWKFKDKLLYELDVEFTDEFLEKVEQYMVENVDSERY